MRKLPENVHSMPFGDFVRVEARKREIGVDEFEATLQSENILYQTRGTGYGNILEIEIKKLATQYLAITDFRLTPMGMFLPTTKYLVQGTGVKE
ncbi:MAG: hypothetical protein KKF46_05850 [Nanoarchaeota archaeon]|nr:hypothetical protein [Nanoarchaeota archaeon]MBU1321856.1 hypothetical protein [Nanoarchaeota archaeon]MBU1597201.1 hypothetical protein [Nanoarchaeota archaeon]